MVVPLSQYGRLSSISLTADVNAQDFLSAFSSQLCIFTVLTVNPFSYFFFLARYPLEMGRPKKAGTSSALVAVDVDEGRGKGQG